VGVEQAVEPSTVPASLTNLEGCKKRLLVVSKGNALDTGVIGGHDPEHGIQPATPVASAAWL
jgi:hypothetical protein